MRGSDITMAKKKKKRSFTKTDMKALIIGIIMLATLIFARISLNSIAADWVLDVLTGIITFLGVGLLIFLISELAGASIANKLRGK